MINNLKPIDKEEKNPDLTNIEDKTDTDHLVKVARLYLVNGEDSSKSINQTVHVIFKNTKKILPKIVGDIRHYPPANKEWKNSIYAYNKNSLRSTAAQDKVANRTIKSYFNLTNNRKLARSYRMRNLIRRTTSKRIFASKPEIKQTSNKVNITVYILNREGQFLLRKLYFYKKNMNINRDVYLHKIWLKKNILALKRTFKSKKSIRLLARNKKLKTRRTNKNKTYIHNILIKRYLNNSDQLEPSNAIMNKSKDLLSKSPLGEKNKKKSIISTNVTSESKDNKEKTQGKALNKKRITNSLILREMHKSLKKRNLIQALKKREKLSTILIPYENTDRKAKYISEKIDLLSKTKINLSLKSFENYLLEKKSRKVKLKLRNSTSIFRIRKRLARFFIFKGKRRRKRSKRIRLPYSNLKFRKEVKFFSFKLVSELKYVRKLFLFRFLKYIFFLLKIRIHFSRSLKRSKSVLRTSRKNLLNRAKNSHFFNNLRYEFIENNNKNMKKLNKSKKSNKAKNYNRSKMNEKNKNIVKTGFKNRYSYSKLKKIELLNLELLNFLKYIASGKKQGRSLFSKKLRVLKLRKVVNKNMLNIVFNKNNYNILYKKFEKKYFLRFLAKYFKKEFLYINYFSRFLINRFKFNKFLPGLKYLLNRIYSKKVKLNIVNLKYPHLNSDIYADSIASKLRKKLSLLRVLRSSLSLAKLPYDYLSYDKFAGYNKLSSLTIHSTLNVKNLWKQNNFGAESLVNKQQLDKDPLDLVLNKVYPYSFVTPAILSSFDSDDRFKITQDNSNSLELVSNLPKPYASATHNETYYPAKNLKILNIIKYKWVSGVRLEAAGRLTRRYTAARSVFKFRYKGSLKNIDYSQKSDATKKNASSVMLRNYAKANSQYSFSKSKRRIGAFGLKAKIASY